MPEPAQSMYAEEDKAAQAAGDQTSDEIAKAPNAEQFAINTFTDYFQVAKSYREQYYDPVWDLIDDAYNGIARALETNDTEDEYRSNIRMREAYVQVESMSAKIVPSLFMQNPPISVRPFLWTELSARKSYAIERFLHANNTQRFRPVEEVTNWIKSGCLYGLGVMKQTWQYDYGYMTKRAQIFDANGSPSGILRARYEGVREDHPEFSHIQTRNVWWNPDACGRSTLRWIIEEYYRPLSWVQKMGREGFYQNTDHLTASSENDIQAHTAEQNRTGAEKNLHDVGEDIVLVHELWTPDFMMVIANETVVLKFRDNPYDSRIIPYYFFRDTIVPGHFVGFGEVEPILELEEGENTIRNMRLDNLNRCIHKQIFAGASSGLKGKRMRWTPMGLHVVTDVSQVKWFDVGDVTQSSYVEEAKYESQIDKTNGNSDLMRGEGGKRQSATEASIRTNSSNLRTDLKAQLAQFEFGFTYRDQWTLWRQFGDPQRVIQVVGEDGDTLRYDAKDLFSEDVEFSFNGGGYFGSRILDQMQFTQLLNGVLANPIIASQYEPRELARAVAYLFPSYVDTRRLLKKPAGMAAGWTKDPFYENTMMLLGDEPEVIEGEPHADHKTAHAAILDNPRVSTSARQRVTKHIMKHDVYMNRDFEALGILGGAKSSMKRMMSPGSDMMGMTQANAMNPGGLTVGAVNNFAPGQYQ